MNNYRFFLCLIVLMLAACATKTEASSVSVGEQTWSARNLDVSTFRNGDAIPEFKDAAAWGAAAEAGNPAWCYYENDAKNGEAHGRLYNWFAVNDARGLAPQGWHVPSRKEWEIVASKLKEEALFSSERGGFRHMAGNFRLIGSVGYWWTATETEPKVTAWLRQTSGEKVPHEQNAGKGTGLSVRLVRDSP